MKVEGPFLNGRKLYETFICTGMNYAVAVDHYFTGEWFVRLDHNNRYITNNPLDAFAMAHSYGHSVPGQPWSQEMQDAWAWTCHGKRIIPWAW